jgi:hypothetical protein
MNSEQRLKVQAWLDGELSDAEARSIAALATEDKEAQALAQELRTTKSFLAGNELQPSLPESTDFYWSKVRREIERNDSASPAARPHSWVAWVLSWRRLLIPLSGAALIAILALMPPTITHQPVEANLLPLAGMTELVEVENLSEHFDSICYKSQEDNMLIVYLYNKDPQTIQEAELDLKFDPVDNIDLQ